MLKERSVNALPVLKSIFYRRDKKAQHEASCSRLEAIEEQQQNVSLAPCQLQINYDIILSI